MAGTAAQQAADNAQRGSVLRVDAGTLFTADGVPIQLRQVTAKIIAHHSDKNDPKPKGCEDGSGGDDPPKSEVVVIQQGNVIISSDSLTKLLDKKVGEKGKLKDLKFSTDPKKNEIEISGKRRR